MNELSITFDEVRERIADCLAFCHHRGAEVGREAIASAYRSGILADAAHRVFPESCHTSVVDPNSAFRAFLFQRNRLLGREKACIGLCEVEILRPRAILLTDWRKSLFDGAAAIETDGFINEDGMPPWDCWVDIVPVGETQGVLSWVPQILGRKANIAVLADAAQCMSWVTVEKTGKLRVLGWGDRWPLESDNV